MNAFLKLLVICLALAGEGLVRSGFAGPGINPEAERRESWEALSDGEKEKLRTVLREVWTDPSVMIARDEVKSATEVYQKAIREAVSKADPSVANLIVKVEKSAEVRHDRHGGLPSGRSGLYRRSLDYPMSPPGFLEKLTIKEQERFRKAELAAKETAKVKEARNLLNTLQKQDEECRRERLEAHREMRQTILSAMLEVDPGVKELQDRLNMSSASGPGGSKPKGSGKAKYPNVKKKSDPVLEK
jgi:hypothetical protein